MRSSSGSRRRRRHELGQHVEHLGAELRVAGCDAALADRVGERGVHRLLAFVDVEGRVDGVAELRRVALGKAEEREDHGGREQPGERADVVEAFAADERVEELGADRADARLEVRDRPRCEGAAHQLAQLGVRGRIHHDQHRDAHVGVGHGLDDDAMGGDERLVVGESGEHVVVARERVEVVALVVPHGCLVAHSPPHRVRVGVDGVVVRVVVDVRRSHR